MQKKEKNLPFRSKNFKTPQIAAKTAKAMVDTGKKA